MSRFARILLWLPALGIQPLFSQSPAIESVLRAELAFAAQAEQKGIRPAFLTWLKPEAKVFTPRMTTAAAQYGKEPGDSGHLAWYPEAMGISASGDLAWSLGPWTYAGKKGEAVLVHGHFLSVWHKQVSGPWRVVADIGVPHAAPIQAIEPFAPWEAPPARKSPRNVPDATPVLRQLEAALSLAWARQGGAALLPHLAKGGRVLRSGSLPLQNEGEIRKALERDRPGAGWTPGLIQVASSGDLAWTCGETEGDPAGASASFLRVWVLESGTWKILFDVRLPVPKPAA